jgi:methionine-rich copper-binding protein CopC
MGLFQSEIIGISSFLGERNFVMTHQKAQRNTSRRYRNSLSKRNNGIEQRSRLKVEHLEARVVPSSSNTKPLLVPGTLGLDYTGVSEAAHGVNISGQPSNVFTPGQYQVGAPTVSAADFNAYLQNLAKMLQGLNTSGSGINPAYQSLVSAGVSPSLLSQIIQSNPNPGQDPDQQTGSNANIFSLQSYLERLKLDPGKVTGISNPALNPTVLNGFDGMNFLDSVNGYIPPDTDMAVGPQFVIETVNAQIQFYDKTTGAALLPNTPLNQFFGQPGESPFDPVVTYDDIAGRFIVAAPTFASNLLLAVSRDSNPFDGFSTYDLNINEGGFFPDYPKIGYNADEVVLTFNMYPGPGNFHVQILAFSASSIFSNPASLTLGSDYFSNDRATNAFGQQDFTLAAASMHGAAPGSPMYFVEENGFDNGSQMDVVAATNLLSTSPSFTDNAISVDPYTYPPSAQQPGGSVQTNDTRILNADWRDNILVADQNVGMSTDGDAHARWYEFNTSGTSASFNQDGTIAPAPGTSTYFPAIAIAPGDVIAMVYNESSATEYPSVYDTGRTTGDPTGTMETPALAHAGTATYSDFGFRWGDYSGISIDPTDGTIWSGMEYSTSLLSGDPANWATWISHFAIAPSVVASNPAAGSVVAGTAPTTFSLTFSEPIDPTSITASSFTVDGVSANSASLSADGLTITYTFNSSPITTQGSETMSLPAGAVKGAADHLGNVAFSANFFYVKVQLAVMATSPAVGSVLNAPVTDIVVQFNKAFDPYTVTASDFQVSQGTVVKAVPLTSQSVDVTLSGVTQDGTMTLTLPAGAMKDTLGVPNALFTGTYIIQVNTQPYPTPLQGKDPAGSLIYDPSVTGAINFASDTDTYTLPLAAGQTLTLGLAVDPTLIGTLTLKDPNGNVVGTATGAVVGQTVVLETAPVTTAGSYSLIVGGSGGTQGNYTLQAILNAVLKLPTNSINTIGTAEDLSSAFASLGTTPSSDRAGVLGTLDSLASNDFYKFHLNAGQSVTLAAAGLNGGAASLGLFDGSGNLLALPNGASLSGPLNFESGFAGASSQLTFNGSATLNGSNLELTDGGFSEAASAFSTNQLDVSRFSTSFNFQITPGTNPTADGLTFTIQGVGANALGGGGGALGYAGIPTSVAIKFDLYNNAGEGIDSTGIYVNGAYPSVPAIDLTGTGIDLHSGDLFNVVMSYDGSTLNVTITDTATHASASQSYSINIPSTIGGKLGYVGFTGGTGGLTAVQQILNWTFTPASTVISAAKFESINNFVAGASGWYYAQVDGAAGTNYSLVVTRGADFDLHGNSFNNAQPLNGTPVVLGAITKGGGALQALDLQAFAFSNIYQTDPVTGAFGTHIVSPNNNAFFLFGQNMAFDGTFTYYNDGYGDTGTVYKLDSTGTVVGSFTPSNGFTFTGMAYLNGKLYFNAAFDSNIYVYDANTFAFLGTINTGDGAAWVGLTGDPDRGVLWAVAQTGGFSGDLFEIDPTTGAILKQGSDNAQGLYQQDIAYANGELIVSDTNGGDGAGNNFLDEYDPNTFGFLQRIAPPYTFAASGLAGDGLGGQGTDYYQFNVNAGDNLVITTTTPGGTSGNGLQFINDLQPTINLYNAAGNLVATATGNAADGRNDVIDWTALTTGSYRVQILGSSKTNLGEYTIAIQGATGGVGPFDVTATNPAAGSDINTLPTTMTVKVSDSTLLTSVVPADLTIDGQSATSVTAVDNHTFVFTLPPLQGGDPSVHSVSISGLVDIHGVSLTPDNFTFATDTVPPSIVSSSLANGSVFSPAPQNVTEVVTFSESMNTSLTPSIDLFGEFRGIHYSAASFSWDATGTVLTINYANLPSDAYQFNLDTTGFQDLAGNTLTSGLTTNFSVVVGTASISGLQPVQPLGSLVYNTSLDNVLVSSSDVDTYQLSIDPRQTLAVLVTPVTSSMTATITITAPDNTVTTVTSPSPGAPALIPAIQSLNGGTYVIQVSGGPGEYTIVPTLNALVDPASFGGPPNNTIGTAQPLDAYANNFAGNDNRTAVLGQITGTSATFGDALVVTTGFSGNVELINKGDGSVLKTYSSPAFSGLYLFDVKLAADNTFWVLGDLNLFTGELIHMDLAGDTLGTIISPVSDSPGFLSPEGFGIDPKDGSFWLALANSGNVVHLDSSGNLLNEYFIGPNVDSAAVGPDGRVYVSLVFTNQIDVLDPSTGNVSFFTSSPFPLDLTWSVAGDLWVGALDGGAQEFDSSGNLIATYDTFGATAAEPALSGNVWDTNIFTSLINQFSSAGTLLTSTSAPLFQPGLAVLGDVPGEAQIPPPSTPVYSFALNQGESATIALQGLSQGNLQFVLYDQSGNVLAFGSPGATNYTEGLNNFVAPATGTYYVQVTGDGGAKFNLVLTRGADFTTQNHTTLATAQDITATQQSGDSNKGGALGYLVNPSGANVQSTIEGIDFNTSNCGCLPPDTNAAVGGNYVAEAVNLQFRVFDKTTGNTLLDESLTTLFGQTALSDPYVEYDAGAGHWYVTVVGSANESQVMLAISTDANPLDGFNHVYNVPVAASGDLADFPKLGYNADAIVIEANDFGDGHAVVTAVDKAQALAGTLVDYQSTPSFQFRALVPAQMQGSNPGDPMWFMAATGDPTYDGTHPDTIRVTKMTNILSNSPVYTDYTVSVNTYGPNSGAADQPGAPGSVATNDVSTTQVTYLNGTLVTAFSASTPADGFKTTKAHWYQVDVSGGTPTLIQEGLIDPGSGVATFFPTATQDAGGNIGITYMESSSTEFVSSYVAGHIAGTPLGTTTAGADFAPGAGSMPFSFREGDYSSVVLDPSDGVTFWAANEYSGPNAASDIWNTRIASFTVFAGVGTDYYSVNANAGDHLHFATSTPAGGPNEFVNNFYPALKLYDNNGNLVASADGNAADGRNSVIDFTVPSGGAGTWIIEVTPSANTAKPTTGEYGLQASGATGALPAVQVTGTTPAEGALVQPPTDYIVTFNHSILASSLTPGELTINGVAAAAVTLVNANTVDWTIAPASIPSGDRVLNTAVISADPGSGARVKDVSGAQLGDFTSTFTTDNVPPTVVSSSISNGALFGPAPANLTEVVTFSEPMNTAFTTAASFGLHGNFRNQDIASASFSWDATGTILTINYANVPDDTYTLTLFASGFQDLVGLAPTSDFTVNFAVNFGSGAIPTPLNAVPPLGDLIYTGSLDPVLVTPTDVDNVTLALNAGETLTLAGIPQTSTLQLVITVLNSSNHPIGTATAPAAGQSVTLETAPIATTGTYTIQISDANGNLGLYDIQAYLNSYLKVGTSNDTIATAQDISSSSYLLGPGNADRLAVVGSLPAGAIHSGDAFVASEALNEILQVNGQGHVTKVIPVPQAAPVFGLTGVELSPVDNLLYAAVTTAINPSSVSGELVKIDPVTGAVLGTIPLPDDTISNNQPSQFYPFGFSIAPDGTFWIAQSNSDNIIHVDSSGNVLATFSTGTISPDSATINAAGNVYFTGFTFSTGAGALYLLNPSTATYSVFASEPNVIAADLTSIAATDPSGNGVWVGDFSNGAQRFDQNGVLQQTVGGFGTVQAQTDSNQTSANVWTSNEAFGELIRYDHSGNFQFSVPAPLAFGLTVWGVDNPNAPAQDTQDYYSIALKQGQSATIAVESLNSMGVHVTLVDGSGNVLATGVTGSTNVSESIQNFVAGSAGTYYVEVTGDPGVKYSLTVTRSANFDIEPHNTIYTAQLLTGTNGVLGALDPGGNLTVGSQIEGIDFNGSNCGCLPPDTNAAVGGNYVVENVNVQFRVYDKTSGAVLLDEPLSQFFGASSGGDPYVVFDDIANRWYDEGLDSSDGGFFLNVSNDANPLDGFTTYHLSNGLGGPITDYPKMGFNKDAIFISYNNFGSGGGAATIISIEKAAALSGTLTYFVNTPEFQFRAMPPAQMHGDTTGGVEWFVSTSGSDVSGNTMRVTEMTNYFSNSPSFTYTELPVNPYQSSSTADQPGGSWTTFPNTTTTQVQFRNGKLVTVMASATAADGFVYPKGLYYEIDVSGGTPTLVVQGVIDPGAGVAVQMPSVAIDIHGNLGFTWMEGSSTEYVSMWVGSLDTQGHFSSFDAAPGGGFFFENFRIGDYSSTVVDPTDGTTFWSANEYSGADAATDIWRTHITSFSVPPAVNNDWYSVNVAAGNSLTLTSSTPSDQGNQFPNDASVNIGLYDTFGNLVATGTVLPDGRNETLKYTAPISGTYYIHVFNNPGNSGEYFLSVNTAAYSSGDISGEVYNDLNGSGSLTASDPGLDNWEVEVFDSSNHLVATQLSHGGGLYEIGGLVPGTYKVEEVLQNGWTQTQPTAPFTYTVTVTGGATVSGINFGNFQNITISGEKFNDLTGAGVFLPGDPGLQGWTIDLLNAAGAIVATTVTDANGNYSFSNVGPGTYAIKEVLKPGWIETFPAPPGTYTVSPTSGQAVTGENFGNFQLVTFTGQVYNDLNGDGSNDGGTDPGLKGWTVELLDASNDVVATTTSGANGNFKFAKVGPGTYTLEEINQAGWYQTQPVKPPGTYIVQAISSMNPSGLNFGNFRLVSVSGTVYNDANGDGKQNQGEGGLSGWTVQLLDGHGNVVQSTTTDAKGHYQFNNLYPGSFTVAQVLQSGYAQTQPRYPTTYAITTTSGLNITGETFGDHAATALSPTQVIDNGGTGYSTTGTWTTQNGGYGGTNQYAKTSNGKNNQATATWDFTGLSSGSYDVWVTYWSSGGYSNNAPFTVYYGSQNKTTNLNELMLVTQNQGGLAQGSYLGIGWLELGTFSTTNEIKVVLSNIAKGSNVDADAVMIIKHGASPAAGAVSTSPGSSGTQTAAVTSTSTGTQSASTPVPTNLVFDASNNLSSGSTQSSAQTTATTTPSQLAQVSTQLALGSAVDSLGALLATTINTNSNTTQSEVDNLFSLGYNDGPALGIV